MAWRSPSWSVAATLRQLAPGIHRLLQHVARQCGNAPEVRHRGTIWPLPAAPADTQKHRMMRVHAFIALVSGTALLAACSGGPRQGGSAPTVTYAYRNDAELRDAKDKPD